MRAWPSHYMVYCFYCQMDYWPVQQVDNALAVTDVELLEILEFREAIESQIAELAAERAATHDAEALERVLAQMETAFSRDVDAFFAADRQFHRALAHAAGNRLLMAAANQV